MDEDLPTEFDLIVVGTGFTESIVAAAASRIGKTVLHLDPNDFYGGYWASFNLESIQTVLTNEPNNDKIHKLENNSIKFDDNYCRLKNVQQHWDCVVAPAGDNADSKKKPDDIVGGWTREKIMKDFRKYNIDITPKLLFARGDLVELLISSNICRYVEFRAVDRVTTILEKSIKSVPCSRSDVFTTKDVSVVEKRMLMKLLSNCLNFEEDNEEFKDFKNKTFQEYLRSKKLTPNLCHYILYAISMSNGHTSCIDGVLSTKKFLSSLGRYGNTPFLFPMYGCGEIPQCFCRLCAVFGGVYCLKRSIKEIFFQKIDNRITFEAIQCDKQRIVAKNIIFGHGSIDGAEFDVSEDKKIDSACGRLSRGIFLIDKPLGDESLNSGGGGVLFLKMPPEQSSTSDTANGGCYVIQLSHFSGTVPKGLYLIHLTCESLAGSAKEDVDIYAQKLFGVSDDEKPAVLWSMYFQIPECVKCNSGIETPYDGLHLTCGPSMELDYDKSIADARNLFSKIYPNDEFLPRAPDPEEIIIGDDDDDNEAEKVGEDATIKEKIDDLVEGIENEEKCIEENTLNEDKTSDEAS